MHFWTPSDTDATIGLLLAILVLCCALYMLRPKPERTHYTIVEDLKEIEAAKEETRSLPVTKTAGIGPQHKKPAKTQRKRSSR